MLATLLATRHVGPTDLLWIVVFAFLALAVYLLAARRDVVGACVSVFLAIVVAVFLLG